MDDKLAEKCKKIMQADNIIIDLRMNHGGFIENSMSGLYDNIHSDDYVFTRIFKIPVKAKEILDLYKMSSTLKKENGFYEYRSDLIAKGKDENAGKKVYYLIGQESASATDSYVALIKEIKCGTLIGNNTAGEGFINGYSAFTLKNSGIVCTITDTYSLNSDGTNNSIYGTVPDIYAEISLEDYKLKVQLEEQNEDINTFENRLKWDTVLKKAIEEIEKNK